MCMPSFPSLKTTEEMARYHPEICDITWRRRLIIRLRNSPRVGLQTVVTWSEKARHTGRSNHLMGQTPSNGARWPRSNDPLWLTPPTRTPINNGRVVRLKITHAMCRAHIPPHLQQNPPNYSGRRWETALLPLIWFHLKSKRGGTCYQVTKDRSPGNPKTVRKRRLPPANQQQDDTCLRHTGNTSALNLEIHGSNQRLPRVHPKKEKML